MRQIYFLLMHAFCGEWWFKGDNLNLGVTEIHISLSPPHTSWIRIFRMKIPRCFIYNQHSSGIQNGDTTGPWDFKPEDAWCLGLSLLSRNLSRSGYSGGIKQYEIWGSLPAAFIRRFPCLTKRTTFKKRMGFRWDHSISIFPFYAVAVPVSKQIPLCRQQCD